MVPVTNHNLLTLSNYGAPLCILCTSCGHRGAIYASFLEKTGGGGHSSMTPLAHFRFKCSICKRRKFKLFLAHLHMIPAWIAGNGMPEGFDSDGEPMACPPSRPAET